MNAKGNPQARAHRALNRVLGNPTRAVIGWRKSAGEVIINVPGRPNYVYVTKADATVLIARNEANVPRTAFYPVRMELRQNTWVIVGRDTTSAATLAKLPDADYGVPPHPLWSHLDTTPLQNATAGQVPSWDAASQRWVPADAPEGPQGPPGEDGADGAPGADGTDGTDGAPAGVAFNFRVNGSLGGLTSGDLVIPTPWSAVGFVTALALSHDNADSADVSAWLTTFGASTNTVKGTLLWAKADDPATFVLYQVTGISNASPTEVLAFGTVLVAAGTLDTGDRVVVSFMAAGDALATIPQKTPASSSDTGTAGEICYDSNYFYVCYATDTWARWAHAW